MREFSRFYDKQEPAVSRLPLAVNVMLNYLLTEREGRTGKYCLEVVAVQPRSQGLSYPGNEVTWNYRYFEPRKKTKAVICLRGACHTQRGKISLFISNNGFSL